MSQLFPEGHYQGRVLSVQLISSATKGTPGVRVEIEVEGHKRKADWWISGKAEQYTLEKLRRIGVNLDTDPPSFSQEFFEWACKHNPPNEKGDVYEDWDLARSAAAVKPMDSDRVRLLKAKMASGQPPKPATSPPPAPKRPSPPPAAQPGPPVNPSKVRFATADDAWAELVRKYKTPDEKEWNRLIAEVESRSGRSQDAFAPDDWAYVVDNLLPV